VIIITSKTEDKNKQWDRIPVKPEIGDVIRKISEEEGRYSYAVVARAMRNTYPEYFGLKV